MRCYLAARRLARPTCAQTAVCERRHKVAAAPPPPPEKRRHWRATKPLAAHCNWPAGECSAAAAAAAQERRHCSILPLDYSARRSTRATRTRTEAQRACVFTWRTSSAVLLLRRPRHSPAPPSECNCFQSAEALWSSRGEQQIDLAPNWQNYKQAEDGIRDSPE